MPRIPREETFDSTLALLSEGYRFVSNRCRRFQSDIFETRLMLTPAICVVGEEAARMFYEPDRFTRRGALPITALTLLQDRGSAATLDGEPHRHRKAMLMSVMTPESIQQLADLMAEHWRGYIRQWERRGEVVLHKEVQEILCRAACGWAGVPLPEPEVRWRTREFASMIEGAGAVGPRNWWGQLLRARNEDWIQDVIRQVRSGRLTVPEGSPADVVARHRGLDGELLDVEDAAVELINLLRPTVAVARFVTFAALALHEHPEARRMLRERDDEYLQWFVQEVRRFYPFFPAVGGRAREAFEWRGHHFEKGTWFLLDLYGTNHDARIWEDPDAFRPERFRDWNGSPFNFIPQGGGDHYDNHRCAGEWLTIELVKRAVRLLTIGMRYEVPEQDLTIRLSRMPAIPRSRFVIRGARAGNG
jgi:fatty-acid peroxygenase